jgi:hypothetical protein
MQHVTKQIISHETGEVQVSDNDDSAMRSQARKELSEVNSVRIKQKKRGK